MAKKILVVLTSANEMKSKDGETKPTGWYLPELAHPYDEFVKAGYEMTFVSPKGGEAPLDPASVEMFKSDKSSVEFHAKHQDVWKNTAKLSDYATKAASEFDAVFYPGGHGPMLDLVSDPDSQRTIASFFEAGKPVASVCHGPIVLADVKLSGGDHLVKGKTVTGFTNKEEEQVQLVKFMPFLLEDKLQENGATFVKADPWAEKVVVDGKIITGQNPASAKGVAEALIKVLG